MNHRTLYAVVALAVFWTIVAPSNCPAQKPQRAAGGHALSAAPVRLPATLDDLFPPKAKEPILLLQMHAMNVALAGMLSNLIQKDAVNARANYELFQKEFVKASKLVKEWTPAFVRGPVDRLGKALASGYQGKIMQSVELVGQVCENCHVSYMTPVQQKYHWPDFRNVGVTDPVMKQQVDYARFMQRLNLAFTGIGVDLAEGQPENARDNLGAFRARFATLKETCIACHDTERKYFVDASVMTAIDQLEAAITAASVEPGEVQQLSMTIGQESCFKCHLVHLPAAHAKARWGKPVM